MLDLGRLSTRALIRLKQYYRSRIADRRTNADRRAFFVSNLAAVEEILFRRSIDAVCDFSGRFHGTL